jgi:curved DNA-binding protein CbpA
MMQILYNLWLGGFIFRENWDSPFSDEYKANTLLTKVEIKKVEEETEKVEDKTLAEVLEEHEKNTEPEAVEVIEEELDEQTLLENYLKMIENSTNFYEALGLEPEADQADIKKMYFKFAKKYHPDLFHSQTENNLNQQIQSAFSKVAQAYDTLKNVESRQVYDFKMRKELAQMEKSMQSNSTQEDINLGLKLQKAEENFNKGFNLLLKEDYGNATPFLARAVHLNKNNAKYHIYYGKVLSFDEKQSHKAEAELREAVALDENNPAFRLILAEFYIKIRLFKRAEGELNRLLAKFPNDKEAKTLLDSLQEK